MLIDFDLNLANLSKISMLLQGVPNSGKTHLACDMLRTERAFGPIAFLDIQGEEGYGSGAHMGLGKIGKRASSKQDVLDFAAYCVKEKIHAGVLDGGRHLYMTIMNNVMQAGGASDLPRLPDAKKDGERARTYWSNARFEFEQTITAVKTSVNVLILTSVSAQDVHEITGEKQTAPDIYGKAGSGLIGLFDFAGFMSWRILGPGRLERRISFQARNDAQTRQRLAFPLKEDIVLPEGFGGWSKIKAALEAGLAKKESK